MSTLQTQAQDAPPRRRGLLRGLDRALRRSLTTPRTKDAIRLVLGRLDPENARSLVRSALWTEPELPLSLLGSVPVVCNALIAAADEALAQLEEKLTPALRRELARSLIEDLDVVTFRRVVRRVERLRRELSPLLDELREALRDRSDPGG